MNKKTLFILFGTLVFISCGAKQSNDRFNTRGSDFLDLWTGPTKYQNLFDDRTKEVRIHSEFEPVLTAFLTIWDTPVREAYVQEMRSQFRLDDAQVRALEAEQVKEDRDFLVFILSTVTREPNWADFHKAKSIWRITLENEDSSIQVDPERVELIPAKDETYKYFYRKMGTFTPTYKVRFQRGPLSAFAEVYFHIAGTKGALVADFANSTPMSVINARPEGR